MEERRIRFTDAEFLGAPGVIKARSNLRFSHIGIAVGQCAELELMPQSGEHRQGIGVEDYLVALRQECGEGLTRRRFGFSVRDAMVVQELLNKGLPKQADVVRQLRLLFEQGTAEVCYLLPGGGRQCKRGKPGVEIGPLCRFCGLQRWPDIPKGVIEIEGDKADGGTHKKLLNDVDSSGWKARGDGFTRSRGVAQ